MSVIFREDWSTRTFGQWAFPTVIPAAYTIREVHGCGGGPAFTCSWSPPASSTATVGTAIAAYTAPYTSLAIRLQYAAWSEIGPAPAELCSFASLFDLNQSQMSTQFRGVAYINDAGFLEVAVNNNNTEIPFTSSYAVPMDGTWHGYQLSIVFPNAHTVSIIVAVDNATVLSFSYTPDVLPFPSDCAIQWGYTPGGVAIHCHPDVFNPSPPNFIVSAGIAQVYANVYRFPAHCGPAQIVTGNSLVEIDTDPSIINFPACTTVLPLDGMFCSPPCVVTALDCQRVGDDIRVVISGTDFLPNAFIDLRDQENRFTTGTVVASTDTEIVLAHLDPPFRPGPYCVTVTNPCT